MITTQKAAERYSAIDVVARQVLNSLVLNAPDQWEFYPEIGEHDFERVMDRVMEMAFPPSIDEFRASYSLLEGRVANDSR